MPIDFAGYQFDELTVQANPEPHPDDPKGISNLLKRNIFVHLDVNYNWPFTCKAIYKDGDKIIPGVFFDDGVFVPQPRLKGEKQWKIE